MAKLSANGATVLVKLKARFESNDEGAEVTGRVSTFVIRSDGAILKKGPAENRYGVWKKFKPEHAPKNTAEARQRLTRILTAFGYTVVG